MVYSSRKTAKEVYQSLGISDKSFEDWLGDQEKQTSKAMDSGVGYAPVPEDRAAYKQEGAGVQEALDSSIKKDPEFESLSALIIDQTIDSAKKNIPRMMKEWSKVWDNPTADNLERAAGRSIVTGLLNPLKNEIQMSLARNEDGTWNSKKAEDYYKRTGVRLLSEAEINKLPADQADIVRSYQGDLLDKGAHSLTNIAHGLSAPFVQAYKNLGVAADTARKGEPATALAQSWGAILDVPASLILGLAPMVTELGTNYSEFAQQDPLGALLAKKGAVAAGKRGAAGVKGAFEKVEVPREKTWQDFKRVERPETPVTQPERPAPKTKERRFREMAQQQRDLPEKKMLETVKTMGGGVLAGRLEHIGDLTHRMGKQFSERKSFSDVKPKVERSLEILKRPYGFAREVAENKASTIKSDGLNPEQYHATVNKLLAEYAQLHREIPVYNEMQRAARDAAVSLGEGRYDLTIANLELLKANLDKGVKHWNKVSREDTAVGALTLEGLQGLTIPKIKKILAGMLNEGEKVGSKRKKADLIQEVLTRQEAINKPPTPPTSPGIARTPPQKFTPQPPQYERGGLRGARAAMREEALRQKDARFSPAQKLTDYAQQRAQSDRPWVRAAGEQVLKQQQSGALGWVPGLGNRFAGWEKQWVDAFKKGDEGTRAEQIKMFDALAKIRDESPEVYALYNKIMTEGQQQAGLRYNLLKDISEISDQLGPEGKEVRRLQKLVESEAIQPETYNKRVAKLAEFKDLWDLALKEQDPKKIDKLRGEALKKEPNREPLLDAERVQRRQKFIRPKEYLVAARRLAKVAPTMAQFSYDGVPMTTLGFLLDSRNKKLDPKKVTVKLLDNAEAYKENPALLQLAQEHVGELMNIRRTLDEAGVKMGELYGRDGVTMLGPETLLNNFISGYFPGGKIKKFFDPDRVNDGGNTRALVDVQNHLRLKKEGRQKKKNPNKDELADAAGEEVPPPTLNEFRKALAEDQNAYRIYSQYAANVAAIANRAKMLSNIKKMGLNKRIFKEQKDIPKGYEPYYTQLESRVGSGRSRLVEFGELDGHWVPKTLERNLRLFQEASMDGLGVLSSLQNIFKQTHTVMGIPYFVNTSTGLAIMQMLDGGTPMSIMDGMRSLAKKDKFYEAYRDAGFVFDADRLFGLESGNRSLVMRLTSDIGSKVYKKYQDKPNVKKFFDKAEDLFIKLEDPLQYKKTKAAAKAATVGAATAGLAAYTGFMPATTAAGASVLGLGVLQGLALVKGRNAAMMLDQGSRMGSFKRHVYAQAKILSDRQRIPLEKAVDVVLQNPQQRRQAAQHATYINIDYGYLPEGIETQSKYVPTTPFIKFATRATEMMFDLPAQNPIAMASLNAAQRAYFNNLDDDDMYVHKYAPFNTAGMVMPLGDGLVNLGYMTVPTHGGIFKEAYSLPSTLLGMGGVGPRSAGEYVSRQGREWRSGFPLGTGYLAPLAQIAAGVDRYGKKLEDEDVLPTLFSGFITSVPYYARELEKAFYAGTNQHGMTPGEIFANALALKITPLRTLEVQKEYAKNAYNRRANEIKARYNKTLEQNIGNKKVAEEALLKLRKDKAELDQYLYNAIRKNTKDYFSRTEVPKGR